MAVPVAKYFESRSLADLDIAVNAFLSTLTAVNCLSVSTAPVLKGGKAYYVTTVLYKVS